jgi:hypothetical protein
MRHVKRILASPRFLHIGMLVMITPDAPARAAAIQLARRIRESRHQLAFGCEMAELTERGMRIEKPACARRVMPVFTRSRRLSRLFFSPA